VGPTSVVTTIAGDGRATFGGDGGDALRASLLRPTDVLPLGDGRLLVSDRGNQRVRMLVPVGADLCSVPCDDHDPCTADSCDPTSGCRHAPGADGTGDACQGGTGTACAGGTGACIPGGGPTSVDCLLETVVRGATGRPTVRCTDGDPACDGDPAAGRCGFAVAWCFNGTDPRLACRATGVAKLGIAASASPRAARRRIVTAALGAVTTLAGSPASTRGPTVVLAPPLGTANVCTRAIAVGVALGKHRRRSVVLASVAKAAHRRVDRDRIRLVCEQAR